jgi:hypothetical protein
VRLGAAQGPHLVQHHGQAGLGDLPGGFRAGEAAADDVNGKGSGHDTAYRIGRHGRNTADARRMVGPGQANARRKGRARETMVSRMASIDLGYSGTR